MAEFYFDNLARNLPDVYQKHAEYKCSACGNVWRSSINRQCPKCEGLQTEIVRESTSNNFKILEIERTANEDSRATLDEIAFILDIENAQGAVLDMYGERFGQTRGMANDAQYRIMIKSKIRRGLCDGSYKSIVDAICYTFGCSKDEVTLNEIAPMTVKLENISMRQVAQAGFSVEQAEQIVKSLMPVGVTLETVLFDGTFAFGESENEYDESAGFSEAENGDVGGYLGWANSNQSVDILQI